MKHILLLLASLCLTATAQVKVAIFSINDFHAAFVRNDYKGIAGAPSLFQTLDSLKRVYPVHLTVSAGDNFGGSFFYNATHGALMPVLLNDLGIRISALGNHEFDEGQRALAQKWADSPLRPQGWDLTYVCANVRQASARRIPDFARPVVSVPLTLPGGQTLRVAVAGLITSMTPQQASTRRLSGLHFDGRYTAVLDSVMALPEGSLVEGAHLRLLLTHIGTAANEAGLPEWEDQDADWLKRIDGNRWHGVLSSHTHQTVCGTINEPGIPVVQGNWHGDYISMLVCTVDTAEMRVTSVEPQLVRVTPKQQLEAGPARLQAQIDSLLQHTRTAGGTPIGDRLTYASHTLTHDRNNKFTQTELGTLVCRSYAEAYRQAAKLSPKEVVIGCSHFGTIRANLTQGPVSVLDVGETLPFANRLRAYRLTGKQIQQLVEFGLHNTRFGWLQTSYLRVEQDAESHVTRLMYEAPDHSLRTLKPKQKYVLVTDDYITTGGDGYSPDFFPEKQAIELPQLPTTTDAFINYLRAQESI